MSNDQRLGAMFDAAAEVALGDTQFDDGAVGLISQLPWAVPSDEPRVWARRRDLDQTVRRLAEEYVAEQIRAVTSTGEALLRLADDESFRAAVEDGAQRPPQLVGRLLRPDGVPAERLQVTFGRGISTSGTSMPTAFTATDGSFVLPVPSDLRAASGAAPSLLITGANGTETVRNAFSELQSNGFLGSLRLSRQLDPLPTSLLGRLETLARNGTYSNEQAPEHAQPSVLIGEEDCEIVFRKDTSQDRFQFPVFFRLTDPALSEPTLVYGARKGHAGDQLPQLPVYSPYSPAAALLGGAQALELHLAQRVPIDRPLSVDAFRDGLAKVTPGWWNGVPIASSLSLGYVVQMAQRWTPLGLALGDLVYSLPLAPGEQQRVAIIERTATSTVLESETLEQTEQLSFSERDDTSTAATFASAYQEAASGGSSYATDASSFAVAAAAGIGGVFPFGAAGGGVSTSYGSAQASGQTDTWMSGTRSATSDAAEQTHAATERQAAGRRQAARTGMRMATATESDTVTTKVITNHNKTRALTMQYWEVLRMYDVTTAVEGVTLVCLVPLDVLRFLPAGHPQDLQQAPQDRAAVLSRYGELLKHADVLSFVVPPRYRQGLALITEFAADPNSTVQTGSDPAEDVLSLSLRGSFLPVEDVYVTVVSKRGLRAGPVPLAPPAGLTPIPGTVASDADDAFGSEPELFGYLRDRRANDDVELTGELVLPGSIPRQDVVGFEISRRFRRLDYHYVPPVVHDIAVAESLLSGDVDFGTALADLSRKPSQTASYQPDRLDAELGGPRLKSFSAAIPSPPNPQSSDSAPPLPSVEFASATWGSMLQLSRNPLPVPSRVIPPVLGYSAVLEIEKTLQWTVRNTMTCSLTVYASLTAEERAVLLERYEIQLPPDDHGHVVAVPLLSCVTNNVLGWFGNAMVLPFQVPVAVTAATTKRDPQTHKLIRRGLTTGDIQAALTRFHTDGFDPPHSTIALPTKGVLGEAVLGHCPSAEKIDLTRFWNWQDSPGDEATDISPVTVPTDSLTAGLSAPSNLTGVSPIFNNFSTTPATADSSLAASLAQAAGAQAPFDAAALTNAAQLAGLTGQTLTTADSARADALNSATQIATKAIDAAATITTGGAPDTGTSPPTTSPPTTNPPATGPAGTGSGSTGSGPGTGSGSGTGGAGGADSGAVELQAFPGSSMDDPLLIYFELNDAQIVNNPDDGQVGSDQFLILDEFVAQAQTYAKEITVTGFASPEGDENHDAGLAQDRANAVVSFLRVQMPGKSFTTWIGGTLEGAPEDYPKFRRAAFAVASWLPGVTVVPVPSGTGDQPGTGDGTGDQSGTGGGSGDQPGTGDGSGDQPGTGTQPNFPGVGPGNPLAIYFDVDDATLVDATDDGFATGQHAALDAFATNSRPLAFTIAICGFAGPDDDLTVNPTLAQSRANTVASYLRPEMLPGIDFFVDSGGTLSGTQDQLPRLRRVEVYIDAQVVSVDPPAPPTLRSTS